MRYISTRGNSPSLNFEEVLIAGLAPDGGLYMPESIPEFSTNEIASLAKLSYNELCYEIFKLFINNTIPEKDLKELIDDSYKTFRHSAIATLKSIGHEHWLLELFHGPTLAFKDFALQFLGRLFSYVLEKNNSEIIIIGATSGDTGSAAIHGCRYTKNAQIFILHPLGKISEIQRKQMTTVADPHIHNLAVDGTFDDCQNIIKTLFKEQKDFTKGKALVSVNSINWVRIMAQIPYYFYAALQLGSPARKVSFSVPTGNFGNIFAGYIAYRMGLPIEKLIIATNSNDILARFIKNNLYQKGNVHETCSPSMDIQVSSNFERLIFELYDRDADSLKALMQEFEKNGSISLSSSAYKKAISLFSACRANDYEILSTIREIYNKTGEIVDPHTAAGLYAARTCHNSNIPIITLATAHPAKFPESIKKAIEITPDLPESIKESLKGKERYTNISNSIEKVKSYIGSML